VLWQQRAEDEETRTSEPFKYATHFDESSVLIQKTNKLLQPASRNKLKQITFFATEAPHSSSSEIPVKTIASIDFTYVSQDHPDTACSVQTNMSVFLDATGKELSKEEEVIVIRGAQKCWGNI